MNSQKFLLFLIFFLVLAGSYNFVFAQDTDDFLGVKDFTVQRIAGIITGFACWLISIVLAIMVIALIISGIMFFKATSFVTDGGKTTEINTAKKNFQWVLVGILVILATNVIIATIANALQPGLNYSLLPLNCGPLANTGGRYLTCRGPQDCPAGLICDIGAGQSEGLCLRP